MIEDQQILETESSLKIQNQEEHYENKEDDSKISKVEEEEIEIGDLDLAGLEMACSEKVPKNIPPQQVTLLEKVIIKEKSMKFLGLSFESLRDPNDKNKGKK